MSPLARISSSYSQSLAHMGRVVSATCHLLSHFISLVIMVVRDPKVNLIMVTRTHLRRLSVINLTMVKIVSDKPHNGIDCQ